MIIEFSEQIPIEDIDIGLEDKLKFLSFQRYFIDFVQRTLLSKRNTHLKLEDYRAEINNSYGFAIDKVAYSESSTDIVTRSEMRSHMLDWVREKYSLVKAPKEQLNPQEICRINSELNILKKKYANIKNGKMLH
ncbi:hypothetical protein THRCLA_21089 [Thraustotheca clavata]|uniref:Uncharacterized protein n=1 Tax=Thraustotheca clavata TaxID=74557 RepID=A0A1W0A0A1_9STRA|nr:hypothetical protein THRCLA_21089 [Thraustotheca clavata]